MRDCDVTGIDSIRLHAKKDQKRAMTTKNSANDIYIILFPFIAICSLVAVALSPVWTKLLYGDGSIDCDCSSKEWRYLDWVMVFGNMELPSERNDVRAASDCHDILRKVDIELAKVKELYSINTVPLDVYHKLEERAMAFGKELLQARSALKYYKANEELAIETLNQNGSDDALIIATARLANLSDTVYELIQLNAKLKMGQDDIDDNSYAIVASKLQGFPILGRISDSIYQPVDETHVGYVNEIGLKDSRSNRNNRIEKLEHEISELKSKVSSLRNHNLKLRKSLSGSNTNGNRRKRGN